MKIPLDTIVAFNRDGKMKVRYIRIEDKNGEIFTHEILHCKEYALGHTIKRFDCTYEIDGVQQFVEVGLEVQTNIWYLVSKKN